MKKSFVIAFSLLLSLPVYASFSLGETHLSNTTVPNINALGNTTLFDVKTEEVSVTGPLTFKNLTVAHTGTLTGPVEGTSGQFETLVVTGPLKFETLTVQKDTVITGDASGKDGNFLNLTVVGPFNLTQTTCQNLIVTGSVETTKLIVRDKTVSVGNFNAAESQFGDMTLTAEKVLLKETKAQNILLKKNKENGVLSWLDEGHPQELRLMKNSIIEGDVTFESEKGKIFLEEGSQIKGTIKGAVVQNL